MGHMIFRVIAEADRNRLSISIFRGGGNTFEGQISRFLLRPNIRRKYFKGCEPTFMLTAIFFQDHGPLWRALQRLYGPRLIKVQQLVKLVGKSRIKVMALTLGFGTINNADSALKHWRSQRGSCGTSFAQ